MAAATRPFADVAEKLQVNGSGWRDRELQDLRAELAKITLELKSVSAERDYLRYASAIHEKKIESSGIFDAGPPQKPRLLHTEGRSRATVTADPRIGRPKRILVVGGGPAGLISLNELLNPLNWPAGESLDGYQIQLYERRAEVGGVWYFEPENDIAKGWHHGTAGWHQPAEPEKNGYEEDPLSCAGDVEMLDDMRLLNGAVNKVHPQETIGERKLSNGTPSQGNEDFCYIHKPNAPRWPSPAYEGLVGNVLPPLLELSAEPFPKPSGGLFPSMVETHQYLLNLASPLRKFIKTMQEVTSVQPVFRHGRDHAPTWIVNSNDWSDEGHGAASTQEWDAVIVAAGAFDHPYFPEVPGLEPLLASRSPLIMHAKTYPGPRPFVGQHNKIVVVGNANSANDIAAHLAPLNSHGPLYRCIRHESFFAHLPDARIVDVAPIASIQHNKHNNTLTLALEDGTKLDGVTKLIFASGYQFAFPWIQVPRPEATTDSSTTTAEAAAAAAAPPAPPALEAASKHGAVPNLHRATLLAAAPTLAFIGLAACSIPMPLAEIQARLVARTFSGVQALPAGTAGGLLVDFRARATDLALREDDPARWRTLHMIRGAEERRLTAELLGALEEAEPGASAGLYSWDEWREGVAKGMRAVKEGELRRLRDAKVAAGGVDGGIGGVLADSGVSFPEFARGRSLML